MSCTAAHKNVSAQLGEMPSDIAMAGQSSTPPLAPVKSKSKANGAAAAALTAKLESEGIPTQDVNKLLAQAEEVWRNLDRCPICKAWVSPKKGVCNNPRCRCRGHQVHLTKAWPVKHTPQEVLAKASTPAEQRFKEALEAFHPGEMYDWQSDPVQAYLEMQRDLSKIRNVIYEIRRGEGVSSQWNPLWEGQSGFDEPLRKELAKRLRLALEKIPDGALQQLAYSQGFAFASLLPTAKETGKKNPLAYWLNAVYTPKTASVIQATAIQLWDKLTPAEKDDALQQEANLHAQVVGSNKIAPPADLKYKYFQDEETQAQLKTAYQQSLNELTFTTDQAMAAELGKCGLCGQFVGETGHACPPKLAMWEQAQKIQAASPGNHTPGPVATAVGIMAAVPPKEIAATYLAAGVSPAGLDFLAALPNSNATLASILDKNASTHPQAVEWINNMAQSAPAYVAANQVVAQQLTTPTGNTMSESTAALLDAYATLRQAASDSGSVFPPQIAAATEKITGIEVPPLFKVTDSVAQKLNQYLVSPDWQAGQLGQLAAAHGMPYADQLPDEMAKNWLKGVVSNNPAHAKNMAVLAIKQHLIEQKAAAVATKLTQADSPFSGFDQVAIVSDKSTNPNRPSFTQVATVSLIGQTVAFESEDGEALITDCDSPEEAAAAFSAALNDIKHAAHCPKCGAFVNMADGVCNKGGCGFRFEAGQPWFTPKPADWPTTPDEAVDFGDTLAKNIKALLPAGGPLPPENKAELIGLYKTVKKLNRDFPTTHPIKGVASDLAGLPATSIPEIYIMAGVQPEAVPYIADSHFYPKQMMLSGDSAQKNLYTGNLNEQVQKLPVYEETMNGLLGEIGSLKAGAYTPAQVVKIIGNLKELNGIGMSATILNKFNEFHPDKTLSGPSVMSDKVVSGLNGLSAKDSGLSLAQVQDIAAQLGLKQSGAASRTQAVNYILGETKGPAMFHSQKAKQTIQKNVHIKAAETAVTKFLSQKPNLARYGQNPVISHTDGIPYLGVDKDGQVYIAPINADGKLGEFEPGGVSGFAPKHCPHCGKFTKSYASTCPKCGMSMKTLPAPTPAAVAKNMSWQGNAPASVAESSITPPPPGTATSAEIHYWQEMESYVKSEFPTGKVVAGPGYYYETGTQTMAVSTVIENNGQLFSAIAVGPIGDPIVTASVKVSNAIDPDAVKQVWADDQKGYLDNKYQIVDEDSGIGVENCPNCGKFKSVGVPCLSCEQADGAKFAVAQLADQVQPKGLPLVEPAPAPAPTPLPEPVSAPTPTPPPPAPPKTLPPVAYLKAAPVDPKQIGVVLPELPHGSWGPGKIQLWSSLEDAAKEAGLNVMGGPYLMYAPSAGKGIGKVYGGVWGVGKDGQCHHITSWGAIGAAKVQIQSFGNSSQAKAAYNSKWNDKNKTYDDDFPDDGKGVGVSQCSTCGKFISAEGNCAHCNPDFAKQMASLSAAGVELLAWPSFAQKVAAFNEALNTPVQIEDIPAAPVVSGSTAPVVNFEGAAIPMKAVSSSAIKSVGYDPNKQLLAVEFSSGKAYVYPGVPPMTADSLVDAPSVGVYFNNYIKSGYTAHHAGSVVTGVTETPAAAPVTSAAPAGPTVTFEGTAIPMEKVEGSSVLQMVGYDPAKELLAIEFNSGNVYVYEGVSEHDASGLQNASSPGAYYNKNIKGFYTSHVGDDVDWNSALPAPAPAPKPAQNLTPVMSGPAGAPDPGAPPPKTPTPVATSTSTLKQIAGAVLGKVGGSGGFAGQVAGLVSKMKAKAFGPIGLPRLSQPLSSMTFKHAGNASSLGGSHEKHFYTGSDGQTWLFKPDKSANGWRAKTEMAVANIAHKVGVTTPQVVTHTLGGKVGTLQPMVPNSKAGDNAVNSYTQSQLEDIARAGVARWLTSEHDGWGPNNLVLEDGRVVPIDWGQAYRYFGQDQLDLNYNPNGTYGQGRPLHLEVWDAVRQGKRSLDPNVLLPVIERIEQMPDSEYRQELEPFSQIAAQQPESVAWLSTVKEAAKTKTGKTLNNQEVGQYFIEMALDRKHTIRQDYEKFLSGILGKPFKFKKPANSAAAAETPSIDTFQPVAVPA